MRAAWGEGHDPNASVFGAVHSADQTLRAEAIDSDTDRAWGQIDDWAYRIDGKGPLYNTTSSTPKSERPSPVSSIPAAALSFAKTPGEFTINKIQRGFVTLSHG